MAIPVEDFPNDSESSDAKCKPPNYRMFPSARISIMFLTLFGALVTGGCMNNIGFAITCMVDHDAVMDNNSSSSNDSTVPQVCRDRLLNQSDSGYTGDYAWNGHVQGYVLSGTAWGCLIIAPFIGWVPDKYGAKWCFLIGSAVSAIATLLCPLAAHKYPALVAVRIIQGMGAGVMWPCIMVVVARWAAITEVGTMLSLTSTGLFTGSLVNLLISGVVCSTIHWEWLFYIWGLATFVWMGAWFFLYTDHPERSIFSPSAREINFITYGKSTVKEAAHVNIPWNNILRSPAVWSIVYCCFAMTAFVFFVNDYTPTYMKDVLYQPSVTNGILSAVPFIVQIIGRNLGGQISDRVTCFSPGTNVKIFNTFCLLCPAIFLVGVAFVDCTQVAVAVTLLSLAQFFQSFVTSGYMKGVVLMAPSFSSSIILLGNISGYLGAIIIPYIIPLLVKVPGGTLDQWRHGFIFVAIIMAIGAVSYILVGKGTAEPWGIAQKEDANVVTAYSPDTDKSDLKLPSENNLTDKY